MHAFVGLGNRAVVLIASIAALAAALPAAAGLVLTDSGSELYYTLAVTAGDEVKIDKFCTVTGDVHSNQKVSLETDGVVEGDVSASVEADIKGTVTGTVASPVAARPLPVLLDEAQARALADQIYEGDHDFIDATLDQVVFVDGKARFVGSIGGVGTVIASGDIEVKEVPLGSGPGLLAPGTQLSLIAFKSLKLENARAMRGALYAGTDVVMEKNVTFDGTAVARGKVDIKEGTQAAFLDLDSQPPSAVALSPTSGSWTASATPTIGGSFSDDLSGVAAGSVHLFVDGTEVGPLTVSTGGFSFVPAEALREEFHTVDLTFSDVSGNAGSATWYFGVDLSPPLLGFAAPAAEVVAGAATLEALVSYLDPASGVDLTSLVVELDGAPAACDLGNQTAHCSVTVAGSGDHVLLASVVDRVGNPAVASHAFHFSLDLEPPQVSVSEPQDGALLAQRTVTISGTATDDVGVARVSVAGQTVLVSGGAFSSQVILAEGSQEVVVEAEDVLGRSSETTVSVTVDTLAPGLIVDRPASGSTVNDAQVEVVGRVEEEVGIDRIEVAGVPAEISGDAFAAMVELSEGANTIGVEAFDLAGNSSSASLAVELFSTPSVRILSPADLSYVAATAVDVAGEVGPGTVAVSVNGVAAELDGTSFVAAGVPLIEGGNTLTATAQNADGHLGTASVNLVRDLSPPRLAITSPADGARVFSSTVGVSGLVNDIVAGTVNASEATVTVNGVPAAVANRSFVADAVPLVDGTNVLTVVAEDASGNRAQTSVTVQRSAPDRPWLEIISGDRQLGMAGEEIAQPLVVVARSQAGQPIAGETVLFKVHGDGRFDDGLRRTVGVTDSDGRAMVRLVLGSRSGVGAQAVDALASGFAGPVHFSFDVLPGPPASIVVDAGSQQIGIVGRQLPRPLVAAVIDGGANRLANQPVRFRVVAGSGVLPNGEQEWETQTDSDGRAIAQLVLGPEKGIGKHVVEAAIVGVPEAGIASFTAAAVAAGPSDETAIRGVVLDNTSLPVPGATLRILGTTLTTATDDEGHFRLAPVPVGTVKLIVDGSTVQRPGAWPDLEFTVTTIPGHENDLGMPMFLLPLDLDSGVYVDESHGATLNLSEIPGFALDIAPGSATFPGGSKSGLISVTAVHADRVPMVPNFGQQPRLIVTIQPAGTRFDPPARLTLPNVEGLTAGQVTDFYSFDHDLGHFVSIGPGTVSDDGTVIVSNPGVGIIKAGWHCGGNPATAGTTHDCPECQKCVDDRCVDDNGKSCDDGDECTVHDRCQGGGCTGDPVRILSVHASLDSPVDDRACAGKAVQFRVEVEQENCEDIEYLWDFDDGTTSTEKNPSHVFEEPGTYVVSVGVKCGNCPMARGGDSLVVEGVEEKSYELEYANFIPVSYVIGPPVLYDPFQGCENGPAMIYAGDNRGPDPDATSYRTKSAVTVIPEEACSPSGVDGSPFKDVKPSKVYAWNALDDGVIDENDDDETGDCDRLHLVETASTSEFSVSPERMSPTAMKVHFEGNAKNPLAPISFGITWEFDVIVDSEAGTWMMMGDHDCYPAHEAYIENSPMHVRLPSSNSFLEISTCLFPLTPNIDVDASGSLP